ncbi:hypothetical protein GE061_002367 [Apolygus lucorum]|uniref:Uncharacterized protein n=1 Tax=Apolygus lucorum TaxID=248454 RepID=A0A8S9X6N0_APOLU|nr:hypothetical protein GE061_002367 [Apolygus lucorum]
MTTLRPFLTKQDTTMRQSIPAEERLIATLRFLATGRCYEDLKYSTVETLGKVGVMLSLESSQMSRWRSILSSCSSDNLPVVQPKRPLFPPSPASQPLVDENPEDDPHQVRIAPFIVQSVPENGEHNGVRIRWEEFLQRDSKAVFRPQTRKSLRSTELGWQMFGVRREEQSGSRGQ